MGFGWVKMEHMVRSLASWVDGFHRGVGCKCGVGLSARLVNVQLRCVTLVVASYNDLNPSMSSVCFSLSSFCDPKSPRLRKSFNITTFNLSKYTS